MSPVKTIGVTGNIGSGKSTVAEVFSKLGGRVIIGDELGREVVNESQKFRNWLAEEFPGAFLENGELDRAVLGQIVFNDPLQRHKLDKAIWPGIRELLEKRIDEAHADDRVAVVDAALIFEWHDEERYDAIITVVAEKEISVRRAAQRLGRPEDEMLMRFESQLPDREKARKSDYVLSNDGSLDDLRMKAKQLWFDLGLSQISG